MDHSADVQPTRSNTTRFHRSTTAPTPMNATGVPQPGGEPSIHDPIRNRTEMTMMRVPTVNPVISDDPAMKASNGATPHPAANIHVRPVPRARAPKTKANHERGLRSARPRIHDSVSEFDRTPMPHVPTSSMGTGFW